MVELIFEESILQSDYGPAAALRFLVSAHYCVPQAIPELRDLNVAELTRRVSFTRFPERSLTTSPWSHQFQRQPNGLDPIAVQNAQLNMTTMERRDIVRLLSWPVQPYNAPQNMRVFSTHEKLKEVLRWSLSPISIRSFPYFEKGKWEPKTVLGKFIIAASRSHRDVLPQHWSTSDQVSRREDSTRPVSRWERSRCVQNESDEGESAGLILISISQITILKP